MLRVEGVQKKFDGIRARRGVDFTLEENTSHGIIGPNGSGKTTLFNCIAGLLKPDSGRIWFKEKEITGMQPDKVAKLGIRRTFQEGRLVPSMTVLENVMSGVFQFTLQDIRETFFRLPFTSSKAEDRIREEAVSVLSFFGMQADYDRWAGDLAWAERQFIQLARAIISKPTLLMLDEPNSGMGPTETKKIVRIIEKIHSSSNITVVVISHDVKMLMNLSKFVTVLNFGEKISEGTPKQIQNDPGVLEAYLGAE